MRKASQGEDELAAGACLVWVEACPERGLEKGAEVRLPKLA